MRHKFLVLLILSIMIIPQLAFAGSVSTPALTNIRWSNHVDAATGALTLRMVVDTTGPVQAVGKIEQASQPRLVVSIKNSDASGLSSVDLDGKIANKIAVVSASNSTKLVIDLANTVKNGDFRVFTLASDAKNNKPYRVVVDINKSVPTAAVAAATMNYSFSPGLAHKLIVLDPGHGGSDSGAVGPGKTQEKDDTLAVAMKVKSLLEKGGAKVVMTRTTDVDVFGPNASGVDELGARCDVANTRKADLFLSIHCNSFTNASVNGAATYYYPKSDYDLMFAQALQNSYIQATGLQDRGTFQANFYVVKHTTMPAALIELAFISNPDEEKKLSDNQFQQTMAQGIAQGINSFFLQAAGKGGDQS